MIILNTNATEIHHVFYVVVLRHLQIQIYIISSKIIFHIYFPLYYQSRYYVYTFKIVLIYFRRLINLLSQIFTIKIVMYLMLVRICSNKWQIISLVFSSLPKFPFLSLLLLNVYPLFLPNWLSSSSLSDSQYCFSSFFLFIKRLKTLQSLSFLIAPTFSREPISSVPCIYHINYAICLFL